MALKSSTDGDNLHELKDVSKKEEIVDEYHATSSFKTEDCQYDLASASTHSFDKASEISSNTCNNSDTETASGGTEIRRRKFSRFRHKEYQCDDCDRMFTLKHNLQNHIILYHMGCLRIKKACVSIKCKVCGKIYSAPSVLNDHMLTEHNMSAASKECTICHEMFLHDSALNRHIKQDHSKENRKCTYEGCNHPGFKFMKDLNQHIKEVHKQDRYTCDICAATYGKLAHKVRHMKSHMVARLSKQRDQLKRTVDVKDVDAKDLDSAYDSEEVKLKEIPNDAIEIDAPLSARLRNFHPELEAVPIKKRVARKICKDEILAKIK